jgi:hypothetical protein
MRTREIYLPSFQVASMAPLARSACARRRRRIALLELKLLLKQPACIGQVSIGGIATKLVAAHRSMRALQHAHAQLRWRSACCAAQRMLRSARTVPMIGRKSRTLELLAFDEYCRFDTSA